MLSTILIATLVVDLIVRLTVVLVAGLIVVLTGFLVAIPGNPGSNLYSNPVVILIVADVQAAACCGSRRVQLIYALWWKQRTDVG